MNIFQKLLKISVITVTLFLTPLSVSLNQDILPIMNESDLVFSFQNSEDIRIVDIVSNVAHAETTTKSCGLDFGCHIVNLLELILVNTTQFFAGIAGFVLDFFISFSIKSTSYRDTGFVEAGWEIIRDFTNIIFIFALLVVAFKLVLGSDDGKTKKILVKTILVTLTINFSLFFVYAIIDSSNLLAYTFYNKIEAPEITFNAEGGAIASAPEISGQPGQNNSTTNFNSNVDLNSSKTDRSVSLALLSKVNPQKTLDKLTGENDAARLIMIFMVAAMNITFIFLFLSVSLLFLGRTLGLMIFGILAPFAMATLALGSWGTNLSYVGWNKWFPELLKLSFMAPVFLFFLYLITLFSKITDNMNIENSGGIIATVFQLALPMLTIFVLIKFAKTITTKMAGEIGGQVSSYANKAIGGAVAVGSIVATGGAAAAGGLASAGAMAAKAGGATKTASRLQNFSKSARATNFNFAQSRVGKFASKTTGIDMGARMGELSTNRAILAGERTKAKAQDIYSGRSTAEKTAKFEEERAKIREMSSKDENGVRGWQSKLQKAEEQKVLKDAKDKASADRAKAEASFEKPLQEAKQQQAEEQQKRDNNPEFKELVDTLKDKEAEQTKLQSELNTLVKEKQGLGPRQAGFGADNSQHDAVEIKIKTKQNEMEKVKGEIKTNLEQQNTLSQPLNNATNIVNNIDNKKKAAGKAAEDASRAESAKKITENDKSEKGQKLANKIMSGKGPESEEEKLLKRLAKKLEEDK